MGPCTGYEFGEFRLDRQSRILFKGDVTVALTPKAVDLLVTLVEKKGQLAAKNELMAAVWPGTFVEESNLTSNISILRRQLGVHPDGGEYIETIPKRGYRFVAPVNEICNGNPFIDAAVGRAEPAPPPAVDQTPTDDPVRASFKERAFPFRAGIAGAGLLCGLSILYFVLARSVPQAGNAAAALAVLPLENLSGDAAQDYFADGMTEALTAGLGRISSLRVIARASVMQYKGTKKPLLEIAQRLNVDLLISGSVQRSGQRVRITVALIRPATGQQLWAGTYDQNLRDILDLQNDLARAIVSEVHAKVMPAERLRMARRRVVSPDAYEAYLKGRYHWHQFTPEALQKSIEYFEQAIALDPGYAEAHAGLADAWISIHFIGAAPLEQAHPKALQAATKALQLDDSLAEAHAALATIKAHEWDWASSEQETWKAFNLNPGYAPAHAVYSNRLRYLGRTEESIAEAKRALELDPLSALSNESLGDAYLSARRYDEAIAQYQKTLDLFPGQSPSRDSLGWAYVYKGMYDKGIEEITKSYGEDPDFSPELAYVHAVRGARGKAQLILQRLLSISKQVPIAPHHFVLIHVGLGNNREALSYLEKAYEQRSPMMNWLKVDPRFDGIRQAPEFQSLMRRVGLL
jgi:TolB-like protein/DNA-binding winged helix-turn-helix (wHTH) protein/Tfp pilus assembly protein PilF